MHPVPTDGLNRLLFYIDDRLARLRWSREDLFKEGGPSPATLRGAARTGRELSARSLARLDSTLDWEVGSASLVLAGGKPTVRISDLVTASLTLIDEEMQGSHGCGAMRCVIEVKNLLLDVAQRLDDFYTEQAGPARCGADACHC